ncbi:sensor histidine kinase [Larkinella soli]|uniref:sensor histidine kinase n=1 Tax=Larkinella soli TaxID=1770527 RepID=UPI000FFC98E6|nr:histidine kinase [Larkinella soli]
MLTDKLLSRWLFTAWLVLGLLYGIQQYLFFSLEGTTCNFWGTLVDQLPNFALWGVYSLLIFRLNHRFPIRADNRLSRGLLHLAVATAFAAFHIGVLGSVRWLWFSCCEADTFVGHLAVYSRAWFFFQYVLYGLVLLLVNALQWHDRYRARREQALLLEKQLTEAELRILKMQLNPHFLFNALNTVSMLIRVQEPEQATRTLAALGHLLREYLKTSATQQVSVEREVTNLKRYLAIEQVRFQNRFRYEITVSPESRSALIPDLLLQPLVENALRHGFACRMTDCRLEVGIRTDGQSVQVVLSDNGCGFDPETVRRGIGLNNTVQRLEKIYGPEAAFRIESAPGAGTRLTLRLPFQTSVPDEQPEALESLRN